VIGHKNYNIHRKYGVSYNTFSTRMAKFLGLIFDKMKVWKKEGRIERFFLPSYVKIYAAYIMNSKGNT